MSSRVCASGTGGAGVGSGTAVAEPSVPVEPEEAEAVAAPRWCLEVTFCSSSAAITASTMAMTTRMTTTARLLFD